MKSPLLYKINPQVFGFSSIIVLIFVILGVSFPERMSNIFSTLQDLIVTGFGWFYVLAVAFFLIFTIVLYFSKFGKIRLGKDSDRPEYSNTTWFAMLFSAGMGIGLLFYSVAEPILHFAEPKDANPETINAAMEAINLTYFHWGLHAWAIYIIVGLALAYFSYRHDLPLTIRSTLYPIFGDKIYGIRGNIVEIIAIFGTVFGVATSLGLGAMQINAGVDYIGLLSYSLNNQILLIAIITLIATLSVASGLDRGIKRLSQFNITLGLMLVLFVLIVGPTIFLLSSYVQSIGFYVQNIVYLTFQTDAFIGLDWQKSWTMFYWGWWISWSPFVGMFIARISKGRTIREFVLGVLLVPTLITFLWIVVFGNTAIHMELFGDGGIIEAVQESVPTSLYVLLDQLPGALITTAIATIVIVTFFVTSSDSGSLVISILSSGGNPHPPIVLRVFWSLLQGAVAAILLITGGLASLETAALTTALPFSFVMLLMCYSLYKGLKTETLGYKVVDTDIPPPPETTSRIKTKTLIKELLGRND
ncbi:BCCT family transporter [Methanosalsum natronophilum]|uniref:BCCT family transporter n=1 Tax=Methanosalsum natronophilum TaxID=768733 RepID=A0A3R7YIL8_9EURY|nr:BCCT family transporter [Methanosalsum natronophilum]MCS3924177.1 choline/glycine/proline betaine transport protein [Methanosalsum natronophilum]RQD85620.1 MAG: BCCT family transporter [Methanosalsum natronophilum]